MPPASRQELLERLAKGQAIPALLLLGEEHYLRDSLKVALIDACVPPGARDWGVSRYSAAAGGFAAAISQAQTLPMLCPRQVVFLDDVEAMEKLNDDARDHAVESVTEYLNDPAPFTVLVFMAGHLDLRMRLGKVLVEKALVVNMDVGGNPEEKARLAASLAAKMAEELGATLDREAAEELSEMLNANLTQIHSEIEKLVTYVGDRKRVTLKDVEALVIGEKRNTVWQLADIFAAGNPQKALEFLDGVLRQGEDPVAMIGAIAWMFRKLLEAQQLPANSVSWQAARSLGMRPDGAELALRNSRKISRAHLLEGLATLYEADSRVKSGGISQRAVMEFLAVKLSAPQASRQCPASCGIQCRSTSQGMRN
jgi:DNA polymerase-3 subunit delta